MGAIQESAVNDANDVHRKRKTRNQNVNAWKARQSATTKPVPDADGWTVVPGRASPPVEKRQASPSRMENPFGALSENEANTNETAEDVVEKDDAEDVEESQRLDWNMPVDSSRNAAFSPSMTQTTSMPLAQERSATQTLILPGQQPILYDDDGDVYQPASKSGSAEAPYVEHGAHVDSVARL